VKPEDLDEAALIRAQVALCAVERELRDKGRLEAAEGLAIAALVLEHLLMSLAQRAKQRPLWCSECTNPHRPPDSPCPVHGAR
jgi:hypothetical protein